MKRLLLLFVVLIAMTACKNTNDSVDLRIYNASEYDFKNIIVNPSDGEVDFGDLESGQESEYKKFKTVYSYAFMELDINGERYSFQPIDYVGETPLISGKYTYQVDVDTDRKELILTLVEEE